MQTSQQTPLRKSKKLKPWQVAPYVFISPFFILFILFGLFPLLFSLYLSFFSLDTGAPIETMKYIGWDNFRYNFQEPLFWKAMWNTFYLAVASGLPQHVVAIPLAYFIHTNIKKFRNVALAIYFFPFITSTVVVGLIFSTMFSEQSGLINGIIGLIHDHIPLLGSLMPDNNIQWLGGSGDLTKPVIAFEIFWRYLGWNTVMYMAGLQTIPADLYEAAEMDGATKFQQFWYITIPLLRPMMFFAITLSVIGGLQLLEDPLIMVGKDGGQLNTGTTLAMYMLTVFRDWGYSGQAAAASWMTFAVILVLVVVNNFVFKLTGSKEGM